MKQIFNKSKPSFFFYSTFLLLCIFCFAPDAIGQPLQYANLSFSEALEKAKSTNKIVFIKLEGSCTPCNAVSNTALSGNEINDFFEKFVCIKVKPDNEDYKNIISEYFIPRTLPLPFFLFVDAKGNYLVSLQNTSSLNRNIYFNLAKDAVTNTDNPPLKLYTDSLLKGNITKELMKQYIIKLNERNLYITDLVEKYVSGLTVKEFEDENELKFLITTASVINSRSFMLTRLNNELFQKVFATIPVEERLKINRKIIAISKEKAIKEKNVSYMYQVAQFLRGTYVNDYKQAQKESNILMMDYYHGVKDSVQYYLTAKQYYNLYIKSLDIDSLCKAELGELNQIKNGLPSKNGILFPIGGQINKISMQLYDISSDEEHLGFALKLSKRTIAYNMPRFIDTYAHILYKLGGKKDAIEWQQKAVDLCESSIDPSNYTIREALTKMKTGTL